MSKGWMRVREAATLLSVSESTIRRRITEGQLRGRSGQSGRQEVFIPAKQREQAQADAAESDATQPAGKSVTLLSEVSDGDAALKTTPDPAAGGLTDESESGLLKRYERLAGGSLVLAQKRADELTQAASAAYENLAHARQQLRQVRKVAVAGWVTASVALALAFVLSLAFGIDSARSQSAAQAGRDAAETAEQQAEALRAELAEVRSGALADSQTSQASAQAD